MPSYDTTDFEPPAPLAKVILRHGDTGATVTDVGMLIDTGADITLLPRKAVERLGVSPLADQQYELLGFDGNRSMAPVVVLDMVFLHRTFRGRYLLIEEDRGILGRDILNHLTLLLDGPRQRWLEHVL